jgi:hypothetical protein
MVRESERGSTALHCTNKKANNWIWELSFDRKCTQNYQLEVSSWPKDISGQIIKWQVRGGVITHDQCLRGDLQILLRTFQDKDCLVTVMECLNYFSSSFLSPRSLNLAIYKELLLTSNWDFPRSVGTLIFMGWSRRSVVLLFFFPFPFKIQINGRQP